MSKIKYLVSSRTAFVTDPAYARFESFLSPPDDLGKCKFAILGIPFEGLMYSPAGARAAPKFIRECLSRLRTFSADLEVDVSDVGICDLGDVDVEPLDYDETYKRVDHILSQVFQSGSVPLILGGSHSITEGTVKSFSKFYGGNIGLLWVDAHTDTFPTPYHGDPHYNGCPMIRLIEDGAVKPDKVAEIGIRGFVTNKSTWDKAKELGVNIFKMDDFSRDGFEKTLEKAIEVVTNGTRTFYTSLDIDAAEGSSVPGTQSPDPNGFTPREMCLISRKAGLAGSGAIDIVEVCPPTDLGSINPMTSRLAAFMLLEVMAGITFRMREKLQTPH